jgi:hypothetical protein
MVPSLGNAIEGSDIETFQSEGLAGCRWYQATAYLLSRTTSGKSEKSGIIKRSSLGGRRRSIEPLYDIREDIFKRVVTRRVE